jgi:pimeloyl-ACP methyl ester carboxylesterase
LFISIVLFFVALALVGLGAVGWIFSNSILKVQPYRLQPEFIITDVTETTVTLPEPPNENQFADTRREGIYNLRWGDSDENSITKVNTFSSVPLNYGRLGDIISDADGKIVRELTVISGEPPKAGDGARLESFVYLRNPKDDHNIDYEDPQFTSDAGKLQAWWIDRTVSKGGSDTAVIMIHGRRRGALQETLRAMPTVVNEGYSVLALAYRNHGDSALSPDGFYHYGESEWQDVVVALDFLQGKGVKNVILYAFSMGAEVMLETYERYNSSLQIKAIILDAPFLDPRTIFQKGARRMNLPLPNLITNWSMVVARLRSGINWQSLDQRALAPNINVPVLLFAGTADSTIPIALIDEFASKVPDIEYHRLEGVEHVESWNHNPEQYEMWLREFLQKIKQQATDSRE